MAPKQRTPSDNAEIAIEDYDLAASRLAWVTSGCPISDAGQRAAVDWHQAECEAARAVLDTCLLHVATERRPA